MAWPAWLHWHRWNVVRQMGAWYYEQCRCGRRRVTRASPWLVGPVDQQWLETGKWRRRGWGLAAAVESLEIWQTATEVRVYFRAEGELRLAAALPMDGRERGILLTAHCLAAIPPYHESSPVEGVAT
jgi:CO/xanthine dehydrogenase Mo-binding subunit